MASRQGVEAPTQWIAWVNALVEPDDLTTAARRAGFDKSTMTRWKQGGSPDPERAVKLARAYGAHPVEALVVMGLITTTEGELAPTSSRDVIRAATAEVLAAELVARINSLDEQVKSLTVCTGCGKTASYVATVQGRTSPPGSAATPQTPAAEPPDSTAYTETA